MHGCNASAQPCHTQRKALDNPTDEQGMANYSALCMCVYALVYLMNPVMLDDGVLSIWTWLIMQFSLFIPFSWVQYKYVLYMCVLVHY